MPVSGMDESGHFAKERLMKYPSVNPKKFPFYLLLFYRGIFGTIQRGQIFTLKYGDY